MHRSQGFNRLDLDNYFPVDNQINAETQCKSYFLILNRQRDLMRDSQASLL